MSIKEYKILFPDALLISEETTTLRSLQVKGKTYEQRYGPRKAKALRTIRSEDALRQYENITQKNVRRKRNWKGFREIAGVTWSSYREGALKRGLEFTVKIEDAWELFEFQNRQCALTGQDIYFNMDVGYLSKHGHQGNTASLDRIDSTVGYIPGNIQWVHKDVNKLKSNWPLDRFLEMCRSVADYSRRKKS